MFMRIRAALAAILFVSAALPAAAEAPTAALDPSTRVELQLALRAYIDNATENGIYRFFDTSAGQATSLTLKAMHPVIFVRDGYYLMCADFVGPDGKDVLLDYVVRRMGRAYVVEQAVAGQRGTLTRMFERVF